MATIITVTSERGITARIDNGKLFIEKIIEVTTKNLYEGWYNTTFEKRVIKVIPLQEIINNAISESIIL